MFWDVPGYEADVRISSFSFFLFFFFRRLDLGHVCMQAVLRRLVESDRCRSLLINYVIYPSLILTEMPKKN